MVCIVSTAKEHVQVERVEEEHDVFATIIAQRNIFKLAIDDRRCLKAGCLTANERFQHVCLQQFRLFLAEILG